MKHPMRKLAILFAMFMAAGAAGAEIVTFQVTATVDFVDDPAYLLGGTITQGDQISGTYTIDTDTPDQDPSEGTALYHHAAAPGIGFDLSAGGHHFVTTPSSEAFDVLIEDSTYGDAYHVVSFDNEPVANDTNVDTIGMQLNDPDGTALTSTALQPTAPDLTVFSEQMFSIDGVSADYYDFFHIDATVTSITEGDAVQGPVIHELQAIIESIYDPHNKLSNVAMGDLVTANYTFDPNTPDMDPAVEYGWYVHAQEPGLGFEVNLGTDIIETDATEAEFEIFIQDNGSDVHDIHSMGAHSPLASGATVDHVVTSLMDPTGTALQSAELTADVPDLSAYDDKFFEIGGPEFFVTGRVISIGAPDPVILSPASGTYEGFQHFDGALIFQPGVEPVDINAFINGSATDFFDTCLPGAPNDQERATLVCPGMSSLLVPGTNQLNLDIVLDDQSVHQETVTYEVIGY